MLTSPHTGTIFQVQRFSLDDGPGIRTTIFLKGCNLHCIWCHNPESIHPRAEVGFERALCTSCGACAAACPNGAQACNGHGRSLDRSACTGCLSCVKVCTSGALAGYGQVITPVQALEIILKDRPFYERSGGGVTFSGGEPMLQTDFLLELLQLCQENHLHTAVDTAGNVPIDRLLAVLPYTGLFLYDIKAFDPGLHRRCTGVENTRILANLRTLSERGARIWVRLPFMPGLNHAPDEIEAIAALLKDIPAVEKVEVLPYHTYGTAKYEQLAAPSSPTPLRAPTRQELLSIQDAYRIRGLHVECPTL